MASTMAVSVGPPCSLPINAGSILRTSIGGCSRRPRCEARPASAEPLWRNVAQGGTGERRLTAAGSVVQRGACQSWVKVAVTGFNGGRRGRSFRISTRKARAPGRAGPVAARGAGRSMPDRSLSGGYRASGYPEVPCGACPSEDRTPVMDRGYAVRCIGSPPRTSRHRGLHWKTRCEEMTRAPEAPSPPAALQERGGRRGPCRICRRRGRPSCVAVFRRRPRGGRRGRASSNPKGSPRGWPCTRRR